MRAGAQDGGGVHVGIVHGLHHSNHMQILVMTEEFFASVFTENQTLMPLSALLIRLCQPAPVALNLFNTSVSMRNVTCVF